MAPRIDPRLGGFAREMRREPSPVEARLWSRLRAYQLGGFKFRRQSVIGGYIVDFFCPARGLIVELDGRTHEAAYDSRRDAVLRNEGFEVLRFGNQEIGQILEGVLRRILIVAGERPERWPERPHPRDASSAASLDPSPSGEGRRDGEAGRGVGTSGPRLGS